MKNTKHTQGEWEIKQPNSSEFHIQSEYGFIAKCQRDGIGGLYEGEANAKLIAAAPELLEALQEALSIFGRGYEPKEGATETIGSRLYLKMQAAIKKAGY